MSLTQTELTKWLAICAERFEGYSVEPKKTFLRIGKKVAQELARQVAPEADVRVNRGGVGGSGDITMHGDRVAVYMVLGLCFIGEPDTFYYRSVKGKKDHSGGQNNWLSFSAFEGLLDGECKAVRAIKAVQRAVA